MSVAKTLNLPIITAFLLGILGSTAPCQLTTNLGTIGYLTKDGTGKRALLINTLWYAAGKATIFLLYGVLIYLLNIQIHKTSIPLFSIIRKFTGLFVILIGLYFLDIIKVKVSVGTSLINNAKKYAGKLKHINSSFVLGIIFSLAFCPTLFWLFFGMVIPLSLKSTIGIFFPLIFALGTLVPLGIFITFISLKKPKARDNLEKFRTHQGWFRISGGILLILVGLIDSIIYWFN